MATRSSSEEFASFFGDGSVRRTDFWATSSIFAFSLICLLLLKLFSDYESRCSAAFLQSGQEKGKLAMSSISARLMLKHGAWNQSSQESQPIISKVSGCRHMQYNLLGSEKGMWPPATMIGSTST